MHQTSPARGLHDFTRTRKRARSDQGGRARQGAAGGSGLVGAGFKAKWQQAAASFEGLKRRRTAGEGVQTGGGGQGGGTLLHSGAHVGRGFQRVPGSGGEVSNALDALTELTWGRD